MILSNSTNRTTRRPIPLGAPTNTRRARRTSTLLRALKTLPPRTTPIPLLLDLHFLLLLLRLPRRLDLVNRSIRPTDPALFLTPTILRPRQTPIDLSDVLWASMFPT